MISNTAPAAPLELIQALVSAFGPHVATGWNDGIPPEIEGAIG